ncbi:unnamed protein product [Ixodes pacificus]
METSTQDLYSHIKTNSSRVLIYERVDLQRKALDCMPVSELYLKAQLALTGYSDQNTNHDESHPGPSLHDFLLLELLHWFKKSFFHWVDTLDCSYCHAPTKMAGRAEPTPEERQGDASRVELHACSRCPNQERFPRYNHPGKLLETRRGRCGEWANCFTLCCRALDFDARYVLDWTDHVWTEVFSYSQKRWLHCDPCEAVCDVPLIYEAGWGKKLSYVVAFSKDEVQDVTWRYTSRFAETLSRRTLYAEGELIRVLLTVTRQLQAHLPEGLRNRMMLKRILELSEFLIPAKATDSEHHGRTSGSLQWRLQRGEMGASSSSVEPFVYRLTNSRCRNVVFRYSASRDEYFILEDGVQIMHFSGWAKGAFSAFRMFRKEEQDWKMTYLARKEDAAEGSISWKLDFSPGNAVKKLEVKCESTTYEDGKVEWHLASESKTILLDDGKKTHTVTCLKGAQALCLKARVSGGRGSNAWQHAQLFRQPLDGQQFALELAVTLTSEHLHLEE